MIAIALIWAGLSIFAVVAFRQLTISNSRR